MRSFLNGGLSGAPSEILRINLKSCASRGVAYEWPLFREPRWAIDSRIRRAAPSGVLERIFKHNERVSR